MSNRLDQEREARLAPKRMNSCKEKLESLGFEVQQIDHTRLEFLYNGKKIMVYPYSGWHTGASIKDGRGFEHLLDQLHRGQ